MTVSDAQAEPGTKQRPLDHVVRAFSSLRIYNYRLYWTGQLVSNTGTWMQRLAQAWLVLNITNSAFAAGAVTFVQYIPITLLSLFGGVFADRIPKRRLLLVTQTISAIQALIMALLTSLGVITLWEIFVLAAVLGTTNAFDSPARQAFPVELVGREEVANAVALNSTLFNASRILGPALAGVAIASIGVAGCFWLNAASFLGTIVALALMKPSLFFSAPPRQRGGTYGLLKEGISYALRTPAVCVLVISLFFFGSFAYNFNILVPLIARFVLHTSDVEYGLLFSALGVGSLGGALLLAYTRMQSQRTVFVGGGLFVAALALEGLSNVYALSCVMLAVAGLCSIIYSASNQTRLQIVVPDALRGRVMSLYTLLIAGTTPIGSLFLGGVGQSVNVQTATVAVAALSALGLLFSWLYLRGKTREDMVRGTVFEEAA